jgi:hypothetical protein
MEAIMLSEAKRRAIARRRVKTGDAIERLFHVCPRCSGMVRLATLSDAEANGLAAFVHGGEIPAFDAVCVSCGMLWNVKRFNPNRSGWVADKMAIGPWTRLDLARIGFVWVSDSGETKHFAIASDGIPQACTKDSGRQQCIRFVFSGTSKH